MIATRPTCAQRPRRSAIACWQRRFAAQEKTPPLSPQGEAAAYKIKPPAELRPDASLRDERGSGVLTAQAVGDPVSRTWVGTSVGITRREAWFWPPIFLQHISANPSLGCGRNLRIARRRPIIPALRRVFYRAGGAKDRPFFSFFPKDRHDASPFTAAPRAGGKRAGLQPPPRR